MMCGRSPLCASLCHIINDRFKYCKELWSFEICGASYCESIQGNINAKGHSRKSLLDDLRALRRHYDQNGHMRSTLNLCHSTQSSATSRNVTRSFIMHGGSQKSTLCRNGSESSMHKLISDGQQDGGHMLFSQMNPCFPLHVGETDIEFYQLKRRQTIKFICMNVRNSTVHRKGTICCQTEILLDQLCIWKVRVLSTRSVNLPCTSEDSKLVAEETRLACLLPHVYPTSPNDHTQQSISIGQE